MYNRFLWLFLGAKWALRDRCESCQKRGHLAMLYRSLRHAVSTRLSGTAGTNAPVLLPLLRPHLAAFRLLLSHTRVRARPFEPAGEDARERGRLSVRGGSLSAHRAAA